MIEIRSKRHDRNPYRSSDADELVELARKQIDAFTTATGRSCEHCSPPMSRYHEFGTEREIEGQEKIVELFKGWKTAFPDAAGTVTSSFASGNTASP